MTTNIQLPDITQSAMLVRFSISAWTAKANDKKVAEEVATKHNTTSDVGRYIKTLVDKAAISAVHNAAFHVRTVFNDGVRILNSTAYFDFTAAMQKALVEYDEKVDTFVSSYEDLVAEAKKKMNGLFNPADYPSPEDIKRKFGHSIVVMPMPDAKDFRVALSQAEADNVRANIEAHVKQTLNDAMKDAWDRLYSEVKHIADILKEKKAVRDSLRENAVALCGILSKINVTGDAHLEEMRKEVERSICAYDPDSIRKSKSLRSKVAKNADDIISKMEAYMGAGK